MLIFFLNFIFIIILLLFQTTILHEFTIYSVRPDCFLILTTLIGIKSGEVKGAAAGFGLGFLQDCLSSSFLGINAFSLGVIGFVFGNLRAKLFFENVFPQVVCTLSAALIKTVIVFFIFLLTTLNKAQAEIVLNKLLLSAVYSALAGPLFIYVFNFISNKMALKMESNRPRSLDKRLIATKPFIQLQ